jgi:hypothetical protein
MSDPRSSEGQNVTLEDRLRTRGLSDDRALYRGRASCIVYPRRHGNGSERHFLSGMDTPVGAAYHSDPGAPLLS